jgi:Pvc16 N-terminal domain
MSNALAIAATTATLRTLLHDEVPKLVPDPQNGNPLDIEVTTQPLDLARKDVTKAQINLFLYHTVINGAWRNLDMPRQVRPGENGAPPLALNLHYLVTAYGSGEKDADALSHRVLGGAMSVLHDHPVLSRDEIKSALELSGLHEQFERLRITPLPMGLEEMSKLWMVFQSQYRISAAYEVTVVLIDSRLPVKAALPVLKRGPDDRGATAVAGAAATLREIRLPHLQSSARLGEDIAILGDRLTLDATTVRFTSTRDLPPIVLTPAAGASPGEITVHVPDGVPALSDWAPGFYTVALAQERSGVPPILSNELPFALAPKITVTLDATTPEDATHFTVDLTVTCTPRIAADQRVLLLFGDRQAAPTSTNTPGNTTQPTTLTFTISAVTAGNHVVRLRVDGVDSIPVSYAGSPPLPQFDPAQTVSVP